MKDSRDPFRIIHNHVAAGRVVRPNGLAGRLTEAKIEILLACPEAGSQPDQNRAQKSRGERYQQHSRHTANERE